ncbi:MAG: element excision factor XisH family protein [Caldilineaceae bacterium]
MAARDLFHNAVRKALNKEGWRITHDPLSLQVGGVEMLIDLGAEQLLAAEREGETIAVEIKSFVKLSAIYEFHLAVGQYRNYFLALRKEDPNCKLFLAVPIDIYEQFFTLPFVQEALEYNEISYLVYDVQLEVIVQWERQNDTER